MRRGFSLVEVVFALLVFEVGMLGVLGSFVLAGRWTARAEVIERAVTASESVLDSLGATSSPIAGTLLLASGTISWSVDSLGRIDLTAAGPDGTVILRAQGRARVP